MAGYVLVDMLEVTDPDKMERYRAGVLATVQTFDGRYLGVGGQAEILEGDWRPAFPVLIEFPTAERAREWYGSDEYRDLKSLRLQATRCNAVLFEGNGFQ